MNVTIKINGDIHIHCNCCGDCDVFNDSFDEDIEMPDTEEDENSELSPEEAEAVMKAVAELIFPLLRAEKDI